MQLSKREIQILLRLLDTENSMTTKQIAELFQVSVRTVKYDLDNIRIWLREQDYELNSKRSKGIWLELSEVTRMELKNELLEVDRFELYPDQELRLNHIILSMLLAEGPLTSHQLASELMVSANTIHSDLDKIEQVLLPYHLMLNRQNRQGFSIQGDEGKIRLLMEVITQKGITEYDIFQIMKQLTRSQNAGRYELYVGNNTSFREYYEIALNEMADLLDPALLDQFNYSELLAIIVRVAIAVVRMQIGRSIGSYKVLQNQTLLLQKKELPFLLMQRVFAHYELPLLEEEYIYIHSDVFEKADQQDIVKLTRSLIEDVSNELDEPFKQDQQLFTNLFAHLSLRLTRKHLFINEYNPFVDDIKAKHPQLFASIKKASSNGIEGSALLINDSFIAYIALHFLVSYEKDRQESNLVRIVYVCSTGIGVTNLIQQKISEELHGIEIASFASVLNANEVILKTNPDLVISIFPIEGIDRPFVKVNPLPTENDIELIREEVKKLNTQQKKTMPRLIPREQVGERQGAEEESRDIIVKAYIIYEELLRSLGPKLNQTYQEAFLLHVMLMVHRITFDSQYQSEGNIDTETLLIHQEVVRKIESIFAQNELVVNRAEITALLQYIQEEPE